jgi:hypothetical protein
MLWGEAHHNSMASSDPKFEEGDDMGAGDNQPLQIMIRAQAWPKTDWLFYAPMSSHVFSSPVDYRLFLNSDSFNEDSTLTSDFDHSISPVHVNYLLYLMHAKPKDTPPGLHEAFNMFKYRGGNTTPNPAGMAPQNGTHKLKHRAQNVEYRGSSKVDNFWGNVEGGKTFCYFVFKMVNVRRIKEYVLSAVERYPCEFTAEYPPLYIPQIVAVRTDEHLLELKDLQGDEPEGEKSMGIPVFVGICENNRDLQANDYSVEREFLCVNALSASKNHLDMLLMSN